MQPAFLPWAGYFNLMAQADEFVFLDDVQLEKQSWQTRNRIILGGEVRWIIVPVRNTHLGQTILETEILDGSRWRDKLERSFSLNYGRHPHYAAAREVIEIVRASAASRLADLNQEVIRFIAARLDLHPRVHRASEIGVDGVRSQRLAAMCKHFGATEYLSPVGAAQYLEEDRFVEYAPSTLRFQSFSPGAYPQRGCSEFHSHLSIIDVIANLGWGASRRYVENGSFEQAQAA